MDPIDPNFAAAAAAEYARKGKAKALSDEVESEIRPPGVFLEDRTFKEEGQWSGYYPGPLAPELEESVGDTHHPPVVTVFRRIPSCMLVRPRAIPPPPPPPPVAQPPANVVGPPVVPPADMGLHPRARVCRKKKCARKRVNPYILVARRPVRGPAARTAAPEVIVISSDSGSDSSSSSSYFSD